MLTLREALQLQIFGERWKVGRIGHNFENDLYKLDGVNILLLSIHLPGDVYTITEVSRSTHEAVRSTVVEETDRDIPQAKSIPSPHEADQCIMRMTGRKAGPHARISIF